ncbi:MAG TPA: hypothetical protein VF698_04465, partial [Thermoanaerobaculia bacterium]
MAFRSRFLALLLFGLGTSLAAQSSSPVRIGHVSAGEARANPEAIVREFFTAYASGDAATAATFWTEATQKTFAARAMRTVRT